MATKLKTFVSRWNNRHVFFEAVIKKTCERVIKVLVSNTPGKTLPLQWTFDIESSEKGGVTGRIQNERLQEDPDFEEIMIYLDFGTVDHWIFPVNAEVLSWEEDGIRYFSKGHRVSGIQASNFSAKAIIEILKIKGKLQRWWETYMNTGRLP